MNINFNAPGGPGKGPLTQILTAIVGALVLVGFLMFGLVVLAILAVAGVILWLYFWWKTRELRKQMRAQVEEQLKAQANGEAGCSTEAPAGDVIEGEAVRVVDDTDRLIR